MHVALVLWQILLAVMGVVVTGTVTYLLLLLAAAAAAKRTKPAGLPGDNSGIRFVILVPAHNEEAVLHATLDSLNRLEYPPHLTETIVIADNCTDRTAEIARGANATVIERFDDKERGKGYALNLAISQVLGRKNRPDAFVIIDADTLVAPAFLSVAARELAANGVDRPLVMQGRYGVLNTNTSWRTDLMAAAFDLFNHVKPLGRNQLRLGISLQGNGMVFTRPVFEMLRWRGDSLTEDVEFSLSLLRDHNVRVTYLPDAQVRAQMPETAGQAKSQRVRWEAGRYRLVRERSLGLLLSGLSRRDIRVFDAGVNLLLLPLAELGGLLAFWGILIGVSAFLKWLYMPQIWIAICLYTVIGLAVYIVGGLKVADAPATAYTALLRAPGYAFWKLATYLAGSKKRSAGDESPEWVRTERLPVTTETTAGTTNQQGQ